MSVRDNQNAKKRNYTLLYEVEKCNKGTSGGECIKEITLIDNPKKYKYIVCHTSCFYYESKNLKHTETRIIPTCLLTDEIVPFQVLSGHSITPTLETYDYADACLGLSLSTAAKINIKARNYLISYKVYATDVL